MSTELTEESTHEDIQAAVDQIVEDRKSDEAPPEEKGDGAAIAEDRDQPHTQDTTAETDSSSDDTAKGEQAGDESWIDDDIKAEVAAYGISEEEAAAFSSREELDRALQLFDKTALEAGRKVMADSEEKEPEPKKEETKEGQSEGRFEFTWDKDEYPEELVADLERMRDHYEDRVTVLESRFAEADARMEEERFDTMVDSLGHSDLFGKSGKETKKELERRKDLFVSVKAQQIGLEKIGRPADLDQSLINRVARMVFAEELGKKDLKARTKKMSKQSSKRGGDSATKGDSPTESLRDEMRRRYKELDGTD